MSLEYSMPKLGHLQEVGTVVEWRKAPGDRIEKGEIWVVIETEKTTVEVESTLTGTLEEILVEPGVSVPVGTPIAIYQPVLETE
jgi:pyruvate dehydrogenase E2 component (dihydrolipoamide acetyltransferase)